MPFIDDEHIDTNEPYTPPVYPDELETEGRVLETELEMRHEAFARLLVHLLAGRSSFPRGPGKKDFDGFIAEAIENPERVGIRCVAMIYAVRPDLLGHRSMKAIAKSFGITRVAFNKHVVAFVEEFPAMKPARCFGKRIAKAVESRRK